MWTTNDVALNDDVIALPEVMVESANADLGCTFKPIFDMVWNAFGYQGSDKYDAHGNWIGAI
ncbi:hypothetical protein AXW67_12215 [Bradyrhizobium neotropicale]|nr:hypothetical protein AXW67_12215 [Bradyrhizobium neotropicale]